MHPNSTVFFFRANLVLQIDVPLASILMPCDFHLEVSAISFPNPLRRADNSVYAKTPGHLAPFFFFFFLHGSQHFRLSIKEAL